MQPDSVFEHLPLPAVLIDCGGIIRGVNRLMREHFRRRGFQDDFRGRHTCEFVASPELEPQLRAFIDEMLETDHVVRTDFAMPAPPTDPSFGCFWGQRIVEDGVVTGAVYVREDITSDVLNTKQRTRSETLFAALGQQVNRIVVFSDVSGEIIACNAVAAAAFGYEPDEMIGRPLSDLSSDPSSHEERFRTMLETGGGEQGVMGARRADGTEFHVDSIVSVIHANGETVLCLMSNDVTLRLLQERQAELDKRVQSLGVLAGGIAHDFNNLLAGISGRLSLASAYAGRVGELPRLLTEAEQAVEQASRLTNQLLTFATGGKPVEERVDLKTLVQSEAAFASVGSAMRFYYDIEDDLRAVTADPGQIRQVIQNLVINAREAMDGTGSIEVVLCNHDVEAGNSSALPPGRYVELRLTDDGPGIPAEVLDRVFEPYFSTKESSGLGLATVHSVMARHDGTVTVASPPGSGATFTIRLPADNGDTIATHDEAGVVDALGEMDHAPLRVLVMDDNLSLLGLLEEMLTVLGHEAEVAEHGEQALQLYRTALDSGQPYDAAILDVTIEGGMGGLETGQALLEMAPHTPVLLMSGYSEDGITANPDEFGFSGFMPKPFGLDDVRRHLQALTTRA